MSDHVSSGSDLNAPLGQLLEPISSKETRDVKPGLERKLSNLAISETNVVQKVNRMSKSQSSATCHRSKNMEVVKEYLISRVSSLVEKIKTCEEERNSILLEVKNLKTTANNSEACGIFEKTCQNLEEMLENLVVPIKNCGECETSKKEGQKIKCRYYNRGFCKYRENCKFFHSTVMCKTYLAEGTCNKVACYDRHPKVCKFWAGSSKGCPRNASCEFLHECIGNVKNHEKSNYHCDDCGLDQYKEYHRKVHTDASPYQQCNGEGEITNRGY